MEASQAQVPSRDTPKLQVTGEHSAPAHRARVGEQGRSGPGARGGWPAASGSAQAAFLPLAAVGFSLLVLVGLTGKHLAQFSLGFVELPGLWGHSSSNVALHLPFLSLLCARSRLRSSDRHVGP